MWFLSPLTLTHWVMVKNTTNINKNHLSPQLIEWWSTIPPMSRTITPRERGFLLILVELLTITQWVKMRGDFYWYWWNYWPSLNEFRWEVIFIDREISTKIPSHLNSLNNGQQFPLYQQKSPLTLTHWVRFNNSTNIINNHFSPQLSSMS
jgi:hypothetical protein